MGAPVVGQRHVRSSTLSALSGKSSAAGHTIPHDYASSKSSLSGKRGIRHARLRKSIPAVKATTNAMVDTESLKNLKDLATEGKSESQVGEKFGDELPATQDGRIDREASASNGMILSGLIESQQDLAHKRSIERAISESSQFRKKNTHKKLPALP